MPRADDYDSPDEAQVSSMERGGQLNTDLALSDSDEETEAKRQRMSDYQDMDML